MQNSAAWTTLLMGTFQSLVSKYEIVILPAILFVVFCPRVHIYFWVAKQSHESLIM
jgi:hypothetical protein